MPKIEAPDAAAAVEPAAAAAAPAPKPQDDLAKLEAIDALLRGPGLPGPATNESVPEKVEDAGETPADPDGAAPEKDQLDYALEVPMASGEKVTLGRLKDAWQEQASAVLAVTEREQAVSRQLDEVREMVNVLEALPPEKVEQAAMQRREHARAEHAAMMQAIPAWQDPAKFEQGRKDIHDLAAAYGPVAQRLVGQVLDAPIVKMLHDYAQLRKAVKAAGQLKPNKSTAPAATRPAVSPAQSATAALINRAKQSKSPADQQAAINSILSR